MTEETINDFNQKINEALRIYKEEGLGSMIYYLDGKKNGEHLAYPYDVEMLEPTRDLVLVLNVVPQTINNLELTDIYQYNYMEKFPALVLKVGPEAEEIGIREGNRVILGRGLPITPLNYSNRLFLCGAYEIVAKM